MDLWVLWAGRPHEILRAAESSRLTLVVSPAIVEEVGEALTRPKLAVRFSPDMQA